MKRPPMILSTSLCYGFKDSFLFSAKIQDGQQKLRKLKFFFVGQDTVVQTFAQNLSIYFSFFTKLQDGRQK